MPKHWVFGLTQRGTRKSHFRVVPKRDRPTLLPIIQDVVTQGSTIYHDDWPVYSHLEQEGFDHGTVVHKYEFVSKEGVCTNTIEGALT